MEQDYLDYYLKFKNEEEFSSFVKNKEDLYPFLDIIGTIYDLQEKPVEGYHVNGRFNAELLDNYKEQLTSAQIEAPKFPKRVWF